MADLDDFFAKKDRKKANKGKKFTTAEETARKLEETGKKIIEKPKLKEKPENPEGTVNETQQVEEDEEWKEFKEEKKDYSGLKIGNLTVSETVDDEIDEDRGSGENLSDQESNETGGKHSGPWKKADGPPAPEPEPAPQSSVVGGVYKPPHLKNPQPEAPLRRYRARNVAPDINSEEYFPTLNAKPAANDAVGAWGKKKKEEGNFEEVRNRGGTRTYNAPEAQTQAPKLSLGNKYDALSQDQS